MSQELRLATMLRRLPDKDPKSEQFLFRLDPPYELNEYCSETEQYEIEYVHWVVASSINNEYADETLIFRSDDEGKILNWGELTGVRPNGTKDAMERLGYRY
jgi:hypothetical protein